MLRVNQSGELGAIRIYGAQRSLAAVLSLTKHLQPRLEHMYMDEMHHYRTFSQMMADNRIRPSVMYPVWSVMSSVMGLATGATPNSIDGCTAAVESVIGEHYNDQIREVAEMEREYEGGNSELKAFRELLVSFRDDELKHLEHANNNVTSPGNVIIEGICRAAIAVSSRI